MGASVFVSLSQKYFINDVLMGFGGTVTNGLRILNLLWQNSIGIWVEFFGIYSH